MANTLTPPQILGSSSCRALRLASRGRADLPSCYSPPLSGKPPGPSPGPPCRPSPHLQISLLTTASVDLPAEWGLRGTPSVSPYPQAPGGTSLTPGKGTRTTCNRPHPQLSPGSCTDVCKDRSSLSPWANLSLALSLSRLPTPPAIPLVEGPARREGLRPRSPVFPAASSSIPSRTHSPGCAPGPSASGSGSFLESALLKANTVTLRNASGGPFSLTPRKTASLQHRSSYQIAEWIGRADPTHPNPRTQPCQLLGPERDPGEIW